MAISNLSSGFRPGVIANSSQRPSSPYTGQMVFQTDTNQMLIWTGTAWVMIADTDQPPGLQLISTTTVSPQSSITVDNVFSSEFENYRIIATNIDLASADSVRLQFRDSGGNIASGHQWGGWFINMTAAAGTGAYGNTGQTSMQIAYSDTGNEVSISIDVYRPNISGQTTITSVSADSGSANFMSGRQTETKTVTGFRIFANGNSNISGTIRVYGYRN